MKVCQKCGGVYNGLNCPDCSPALTTSADTQTCRFCKSEVPAGATACRYCGKDIGVAAELKRTGDALKSVGCFLTLVVTVPILLLFFLGKSC